MAPQAGLEPATLRLTAEQRDGSRGLRIIAEDCSITRFAERRTSDWQLCTRRRLQQIAAVVASKRQEKGNARGISATEPPSRGAGPNQGPATSSTCSCGEAPFDRRPSDTLVHDEPSFDDLRRQPD